MKVGFKKVDVERIHKKLERINFSKRPEVMRNAMHQVGEIVRRQLISNVSGRILKRRTGKLAQSIQSKVMTNGLSVETGSGVKSGSPLPYSDIHEKGGTIKPKNAKYLTIPTSFAMTRAGAAKFTAKDLFNTNPGKVFIAKDMIFLKTGKQSIKPMFILKKEVNIPARRYLSTTADQVRTRVVRVISGALKRELERNV